MEEFMSRKTFDGREILSKVSGLKRSEIDKLWLEVKDNKSKLNKCLRHDFKEISNDITGKRYKCSNCGGEVTSSQQIWYNIGFKHGRSAE
jgi:hypothetical protein